jgi:tRNA threonylcarbamoyl adenosine modification protein (Sua5/YciO/YrdC/YwlC family)
MTAARVRIDPLRPAPRKLQPAVDALRAGDPIIYPTETGYAFGCAISSHRAVEHLRRLKGINAKERKPLTVLVASLSDLARFGFLDNHAFRQVRRLLPGPYTIVLPATSELPRTLRNPGNEVGLRIPSDLICTHLLEALGEPMLNASVRHADEIEELEDVDELHDRYAKEVAVVIDIGPVWPEPSTVLRFDADGVEILRQGKGIYPL